MRILHYSFGMPPERSGGLTKYFLNLAEYQSLNNKIFILRPTKQKVFTSKSFIKKNKRRNSFEVYDLINSLPLTFSDGIKTAPDFMSTCDKKIYDDFFETIDPDIIHVHSLIGLHKEFFEAANNRGIKIIFTSHDYFGLFPLPTFYSENTKIDYAYSSKIDDWVDLSNFAKSTRYLHMYQLSSYRFLKKLKNIFLFINKFKNIDRLNEKSDYMNNRTFIYKDMENLREYFRDIFERIDFYHFNSEISKAVFEYNIKNIKNSAVLPISNRDIYQKKLSQEASSKTIDSKRIGYIGQYSSAKGIYKLIELLGDTEYEVSIFGDSKKINLPNNFRDYGLFDHNEIEKIYSMFDILIVPSQWNETFGFTLSEGITRGKIVLASDKVGSKILLDENNVFEYNITRDKFLNFLKNKKFKNHAHPMYFDKHMKDMGNLYRRILEETQ